MNKINLSEGYRRTFIPPVLKLCATLELLGGGGYQWQTANDHTIIMAKSTLSQIFDEVLLKMEDILCPFWIKFEFSDSTVDSCFRKYKIPGGKRTFSSHVIQL